MKGSSKRDRMSQTAADLVWDRAEHRLQALPSMFCLWARGVPISLCSMKQHRLRRVVIRAGEMVLLKHAGQAGTYRKDVFK